MVAVLAAPGASLAERGLIALTSPIVAIMLSLTLTLMFWIAALIPGAGVLFGWTRLIYSGVFCRLIVQEAPDVETPLWSSKR